MMTYREYLACTSKPKHIGYEIRRLAEALAISHGHQAVIDESSGDTYMVDCDNGWLSITRNGVGLKTLELARIGAIVPSEIGIAYDPSDLCGKTIEEIGVEIDQYREPREGGCF
jgi:hypothetical protein